MVFKQWRIVQIFNDSCTTPDNVNYVILIPSTSQFKLEQDLQTLFNRKLKIFQFQRLFKKMKCFLMYFTIYTKQYKRLRGPIAEDTSIKICSILLEEKINQLKNPNLKIVGPNYLKHKFNVITMDQFNLLCNH